MLKKSRGDDKTFLDSWPIIYILVKLSLVCRIEVNVYNVHAYYRVLWREYVRLSPLTYAKSYNCITEWESISQCAVSKYYSPGARICFSSPTGFF